MANSLRAKLSKLRHDGNITDAEYQKLIAKFDGHDKEIRAKIITAMSKAMKEYYPSCKGAYRDFDVFFHAVMAKVAEQLKEE